MADPLNLVYGAIGAASVFIIGLYITWVWVFPWSLRRWMNRAANQDSKEREIMVDLGNLFMAVMLKQLTENLIRYDKKAKMYTVDDRLKPLINGVQMLLMKQLQMQINKFSGQVKKGLNKAVGNTSNASPLMGIAKMLGIKVDDGQFGEILSLFSSFGGNSAQQQPPDGSNALEGFIEPSE